MAKLTDHARELLTGPNFAFVAELMEDGWPHVSPVWVDLEGDLILVNTAVGRLKERNLRRDERVALSISPLDNPYDHVDIRGRVVRVIDGDEAVAHIDRLGKKYRGWDRYPLPEGEQRVSFLIEPISVR
ncbi:MAG: PPOX class F420-dependent oxidoreductase [Actinobacteria bacterium]|nr:PPOX class F420-dependent oxidoreductase [Actinomycetota bacterium]